MSAIKDQISVLGAVLANPQMIRVKPSLNWFLLRYLRKFRIKKTGGRLIIQSHLPPLNRSRPRVIARRTSASRVADSSRSRYSAG